MYVALNPQKARHFTTKGMHLTLLKPMAYVSTELEPEFREKIDEAIRQEILYVMPDDAAVGMTLAGIGSTTGVEEELESKGDLTIDKESTAKDVHTVKDMFGNVRRSRKVTYTITMPEDPGLCQECGSPGCEGTHMVRPETKTPSGIIIARS